MIIKLEKLIIDFYFSILVLIENTIKYNYV